MNGGVVLLKNVLLSVVLTQERHQMSFQDILIIGAIHTMSDEGDAKCAVSAKCAPYHCRAATEVSTTEIIRLLSQISPIICQTIWAIKIPFFLIAEDDLNQENKPELMNRL